MKLLRIWVIALESVVNEYEVIFGDRTFIDLEIVMLPTKS